MTTRDAFLEPDRWRPRVALDALPFVRVSQYDPMPRGQIALVETAQLDAAINAAMDNASSVLHPQELALADALPVARRTLFVSGRVALRAAIDRVDHSASSAALLRNPRGAPTIPPGLIGSISHKRTTAVAIVVPGPTANGERATIGIDIEERAHVRPRVHDIASRIMTDAELRMLPNDSHARQETVLLFFAMKEAIYKAIDPYVERHVRFKEVEVEAHVSLSNDTGAGSVSLHLPEFQRSGPTVTVHWWKDDNHLFAIARSSRHDG